MEVKLKKIFKFDAAHRLTKLKEGAKCGNLHGHTFRVEIIVRGKVDKDRGWLIDFEDIKKIVKPYIDILDHSYLNQIDGLENPTAENICLWLWEKLKHRLPLLHEIVVWETETSACIYNGD